MPSIYGDSIFESNDMIINRLFESIDNDFKMFEGINESVINESFKESVTKVINKIKEVIRKIKAKIAEIIGKINGNLIYRATIKQIKTDKLPFDIMIPNTAMFNNFIADVFKQYKIIQKCALTKTDEELDAIIDTLNSVDDKFDKDYFKVDPNHGRSVFKSDFWFISDIKTEEDRKKAETLANKMKTAIVSGNGAIKKVQSLMNGIQKDLDKLDKEIETMTNNNTEETNFILSRNKVVAFGYWKIIGYMKDYIGQLNTIIKAVVYHYEDDYLTDEPD